MKIWTQSCRFSHRTRKSSKTQGIFNVFSFFNILFSFSVPMAHEIQENHANQWKSINNIQKQRKMKTNEVANEKTWKSGLKVQILTPNREILTKTQRNFHFLSCFFHFPCPWHLKSRKTMNINKKNGKPSKTKEYEKKWSCKWKNMKIWTQSCRFSLRTRKSSKTQKDFQCFFIFHFFFIFRARGTWNPRKPCKSMKNNGKPSKSKENEKKWSCKWKRHENLDSKLQILTPTQEILTKTRGNFHVLSCFYHLFSFSLPVAPEIQENHVNQRKMEKMKLKMRKKSMKIWTQSCRFSLRTRKSWQKLKEIFIFLSFFNHFPWKFRKTMKINEKQSETKDNKKNEAEKKHMKIWTQSCRFSLRTRKSSKTRRKFLLFFIF